MWRRYMAGQVLWAASGWTLAQRAAERKISVNHIPVTMRWLMQEQRARCLAAVSASRCGSSSSPPGTEPEGSSLGWPRSRRRRFFSGASACSN